MRRASWLVVLPLIAVIGARAQDGRPVPLVGVGIEQKLGAELPLDLKLRDERGATVTLGDLVGGKPIVLNLVYYRCPMLCTLVLDGLVRGLRGVSFRAGDEFNVITVSIDPRDTPALAAAKRETVLSEYARAKDPDGWRFLTGDEEAIRKLADAVGFRFTYDAEQDVYAHAAGIMIATPEGKLARYIYGVEYAPRDLRLALVEASRGAIGGLADQMLLFCYRYDPKTSRYSVATLALVRVGGALTVAAIAAYVLASFRRDRKRAPDGSGSPC